MFKNLRIGSKLIISFILIAVIAVSSGLITAILMRNSDKQYTDILRKDGFSQGDLGMALTLFTDARRTMRDIVMFHGNDEVVESAKERLNEAIVGIDEYLSNVKELLDTDQQKAIYDQMMVAIPAYKEVRAKVYELAESGTPENLAAAQTMMLQDLDPKYDAVFNSMQALMKEKISDAELMSRELSARSTSIFIGTIILVCICLVIAILFGYFISRSITKPIAVCVNRIKGLAEKGDLTSEVKSFDTKDETGELSRATAILVNDVGTMLKEQTTVMSDMANGDLTVDVKAEYVGDFMLLKESTLKILHEFNNTLNQINLSAEQVATGAIQVSNGAQALSQGTTEQAGSIQQLSATITEIADGCKDNAKHALQASEKANDVGNTLGDSMEKMAAMVDAMDAINHTADEIGKIIKTIEDIAFQTNILALNAAVEAARAGSAGQGFAVVADEVRNLASKSAEASKNSATLIEQSLKAVESGVVLAKQTSEALQSTVVGAQAITDRIKKISIASEEQAEGVEQIRQGMDQISIVVQTNSATSEESAAASEELSGQAHMMRELVSHFKLKDDINNEPVMQHGEEFIQNYEEEQGFQSEIDGKY